MKKYLLALLLLILLVACADVTTPMPTVTLPVSSATPTMELAPPPAAIIAPTLAANPTVTPDTRPPPERWQEWPVVPSATGRAIAIYQQGLALGNNPHAFSKVGDCQNVKAAFMGHFDDPQRYNLGDYQYLQETIDNFSGYFNTDGQAVKGGFNAATVLSPLWANQDVCLPGENPLECELRLTKPVIVFISFEVWWEGRTPELYEKYMRQVIETVIAGGAVPILATKADNVEGDHSINLTTARLAHEYDLPLWNFWAAVQSLPYRGLDPERNDGFHISTDGWNVRSFTGLQALDSIWHGVRDATAAGGSIPTLTPVPTRTSGLLLTPVVGPTLGGSVDRLVLGLAMRRGEQYDYQGVYLFDMTTRQTAQILGAGFDFQSASPDGRNILVSQGNSLYRTDGLTLSLLTDQFFSYGKAGALWLPDNRIAFILHQEDGNALMLMQADGSGQIRLTQPGAAPIELYPSTDGLHLAWESGSCSNAGLCDRQGAWLTDLQTGQSRFLNGISRPLISPSGSFMAYTFAPGQNKSNLAFAQADGIPLRVYPLAGDVLTDFAWSPIDDRLIVHMAVRSEYSGLVTDGLNYLVDAQTYGILQFPSLILLNARLLWAPDAASLVLLGTDWQDTAYLIRFRLVDVATRQVADLTGELGLTNPDYIFVTNAAWLARP